MNREVVRSKLQATANLLDKMVETDLGAWSTISVHQKGRLPFSMFREAENSAGDRLTRKMLMPIFSDTKGLLAGVIATWVDLGFVNYEPGLSTYRSIARRWHDPELTVAPYLSHRSGIPHPDLSTKAREPWNTELMLERLSQTKGSFPAGSRTTYHWLTYVWFTHAIISATTMLSAGRALHGIITEPSQIDAYLGVPEQDVGRCGEVARASEYRTNEFAGPNLILDRVYGNPIFFAGAKFAWNDRELTQGELPGGGTWETTDGMSKFYKILFGTKSSTPLLSSSGSTAACSLLFEDIDVITNPPIAPAFGHSSAGGSIHSRWLDSGISFSYFSCMMRTGQIDQRGGFLLESIAAALI